MNLFGKELMLVLQLFNVSFWIKYYFYFQSLKQNEKYNSGKFRFFLMKGLWEINILEYFMEDRVFFFWL